MEENANWYVVHTYSGYENKVSTSLQKIVENRKIGHLFLDIQVPTGIEVEIDKNSERVEKEKKLFPGYVLIKMVMNDDTWYIVRNIRGVTGFVGHSSKPIPLTEEEVLSLGVEKRTINLSYSVGDSVKVNDGPLDGFVGVVEEISTEREKVKLTVSMFGRETPVELDFDQVDTITNS